MAENPILGLAGSLFTTFLNNRMAQENANISYNRQKEFMAMQNNMNMGNVKNAPGVQAFGLRQAGFNPAMVNGAGTQAAPTVSQGNADMPQTIPFNAQDALLFAQMENLGAQTENIEAQTEKTKAETENVPKTGSNIEADTAKKIAETIHEYDKDKATQVGITKTEAETGKIGAEVTKIGAETGKIEAETQSIRNTNEVFTEENKGVALFGQTMAMDWQKQDWYKSLPSGTKMVIDQIADGSVPLSIGSLRALITAIDTDGNMNKMQKDKAEYALSAAVAKGMLSDPKVKSALIKMPETQRNKLIQEIGKLIQENKILKFNYEWNKEKKDVWTHQDPDKLYLEYQKDPSFVNAVQWIVNTVNDKINRALPGAAGAAAGGYTAGKAMNKAQELSKEATGHKKTVTYPEIKNPPLYGPDGQRIKGTGGTESWTEYKSGDQGVQQMFNH